MKSLRLLLMSLTLLALYGTGSSYAQDLQTLPSHTWMGIYVGDNKLGYMHIAIDKDKYEGKDVFRVDSTVRTRLTLLGSKVQQDVTTTLYTDEKYSPIFELFKMSSNGRSTSVEARFKEKSVECTLLSDGTSTKKSVPIPEGVTLVSDSMYGFGPDKAEVGKQAKMHYFNPITISIDPMTLTVLRRENIEVEGKVFDALVVQNQTPMGEMTSYQTDGGDLIKVEAVMGMVMLRETREKALENEEKNYTPSDDLAVMTSVKADKDLPNPRKLKEIKLKLTGLKDASMALNDERQTVKFDPKTKAADYTIVAKSFQAAKSAKLPLPSKGHARYLAESMYIQTNNEKIKEQSKKIVGSETSAYKSATRVRAWVNKNMVPQTDVGIARSAAHILNDRVGVCRDYATLYTALARAAGIPTRIVAGLVYMNGGFYYHAWAESFVGEWVPMDATLPTDFVDATHIKLAEGDATSMFEMSGVIGKLKVEIVEYK